MRDGKGDIFVGREELSYVAGFNIAVLRLALYHITAAI